MPDTEQFVDAKAVAALFAKDRRWVYSNQKRLNLPRYKLGPTQYRYRLSELEAWLQAQPGD